MKFERRPSFTLDQNALPDQERAVRSSPAASGLLEQVEKLQIRAAEKATPTPDPDLKTQPQMEKATMWVAFSLIFVAYF